MDSFSPAVLPRCLRFLGLGIMLLFAASCTSSVSILDVPAPALQAQAAVAPPVEARLSQHTPTTTIVAAHTATPAPTLTPTSIPPTATATPLPTLAPTSVPATATSVPTRIPAKVPTAVPSLVPDLSAPGIPTRLVIPAIGLDAPVVTMGWSVVVRDGQQVSEWDVPDWRAVGWLKTSAPLGIVGNSVLEGHQNVYGRVFENLQYLKEGDTIQVYADSGVRNYTIKIRAIVAEKDQPMEVRLENAKWIAPQNDERLTLITCYPRNSDTHRLILVAYP